MVILSVNLYFEIVYRDGIGVGIGVGTLLTDRMVGQVFSSDNDLE